MTIIAILNIISGIIMLIGGIALVAIGLVLPGGLPDTGMSGLPAGAFGLAPAQVIVSAAMTAALIFSALLFQSYGREKEQAKAPQ